jgi:hypothetical protein
MITRLEFAVLIEELQRLDRPEILGIFEDIHEPRTNRLNNILEKDGIKIEKTNDYPSIRGYHLSDIYK